MCHSVRPVSHTHPPPASITPIAMSSTLSDDKSRDGESPGQEGIRLSQRLSTAESIWVSESLSLTREAAFVAVVCMAQFCTQAAYMGTLVLLRTIGESFHVDSPPRLAWLVGGYSLTVGTFILFSGRLGDIFGYKRMLLTGLAWFSLWSLVAGLSVYSSYTLAVFSRVLQGIGPAICLPNALAILGASYAPGHRKAMVFAFFGAVAPIGGVVGGLFASLLTLAWWPWALWAMAAWLALLTLAGRFAIPDLPPREAPPRTWRGWAEALDLAGALVGVVALVLFNFAWTQAPVSGWGTPVVVVPLVLGLLLFAAFAVVEFRLSPRPLLPLDTVSADVAFVLGAVACGWASFGVWTLYLVQLLQDVRGLSPLLTTAWFLPVVFSGACAAVVTGKLLGPLQVRPPYVMAMALSAFTLGSVLTATTPADQVYWGQTFVSMIVMPFGMDMSFPAATLILSNTVPKRHQGVGASLVNTVVNYGIALGVGFAGTVEVQVHGDGATPDAQLRGFRGALYMGVGLAGLGLAVSLLFVARERIWKRGGRA
ncbi:multidrug-resistance type transporter aminotriazole resistance [Metarhizium acridum]|uniref:multidrug-resistance type transporter aminotriazole resistance n=1 Tax=Metarhizium acridum TaxID=92637 RepID=UPI001C6B83B9|nr:multidrug-resistance type transporter aminotriazole resistance [Metarhizium acridum]KAG8409364.1 multidrug-resistance type transporter aminotriazole resistance [Metarhizium acridum]